MRLLYVIHQFFPDCRSGTEQHCLAMAREAVRRGHSVTVLSLHWDHERQWAPIDLFEQPAEGLRVLRLNHWRGVNPNDVLRDYENLHLEGWFQRVLDEERPDVVHAFHLRQLGSNLLRVVARAGLRLVVTLTDFWFLCPRFTLLRPDGSLCEGPPGGEGGCAPCSNPELVGVVPADDVKPLTNAPSARMRALADRKGRQFDALSLADHVFAPSRFLARIFEQNGFRHPSLRVVPYGLDPGRVAARPIARPRSPLRVGFCGVLSPWKAPHLLIEAVLGGAADVLATIHGKLDQPMFRDYIAGLRAAAADDARIRFAGEYDEAGAAAVFAAMDVLVVPSVWYENTPFVALEALAAGVPVIASDLGGLSEIVVEDRNGALFRAGDAEALRRTIERVAATPAWFAGLDLRAGPTVAECFDQYADGYGA
jgi:glycosyltransferase involved in cell wall biosynthesis